MPLPLSFVVKNGSKIRDNVSASIPVPDVADRHLDVIAGLKRRVGGNADRVELDVPQFDGDPAAARHRVARVDHEVHQYLLDLRRVRQDRREIGPHVHGDLNVRADHPLQHVLHVVHEVIERNRLLGDDLTAG